MACVRAISDLAPLTPTHALRTRGHGRRYLYLSVTFFNCHYNEAFSSLRVEHYKNFLRLHITPSGDLDVYVLGVDKVRSRCCGRGARWDGRCVGHDWYDGAPLGVIRCRSCGRATQTGVVARRLASCARRQLSTEQAGAPRSRRHTSGHHPASGCQLNHKHEPVVAAWCL